MGTGQQLLTLGGMMLLGLLVLRMTTSFATTSDVLAETKYGVLATSIASSVIEEAKGKSFDEKTIDTGIDNVLNITSAAGLGKETGEIYPAFDDFDDFNNFTLVDSSMPSAVFTISCRVYFVEPASPDTRVNYQTWNKRLDVSVASSSMTDTIRMSTVFSYWYFR